MSVTTAHKTRPSLGSGCSLPLLPVRFASSRLCTGYRGDVALCDGGTRRRVRRGGTRTALGAVSAQRTPLSPQSLASRAPDSPPAHPVCAQADHRADHRASEPQGFAGAREFRAHHARHVVLAGCAGACLPGPGVVCAAMCRLATRPLARCRRRRSQTRARCLRNSAWCAARLLDRPSHTHRSSFRVVPDATPLNPRTRTLEPAWLCAWAGPAAPPV